LIALTFDDGPYPFYTPLLLHVLDRSHVAATFFCVGRSAQQFPELIDLIISSGDEIGNHTFNHYKLNGLSDEQVAQQIMEGGAILSAFVGRPIDLFRPPHGRYDKRVLEIASAMGYRTVFWSDAPEDTKNISPALEVQRVLAQASPGGIVLLHSGQYRTIEALPVIIDKLRAEGYTFVTVDQLLTSGGF
jgi:peptidoglycan/xylan/chitin deacetylase (PgdA/CDA1 family)